MRKKILGCVLIVLCMVLLWPVKTLAAQTGGSCGDGLTWTLNDGVLTVSGTGAMTDAPWKDQQGQIREVILKDGVTSICDHAFANCASLKYVTVSGTVSSVESRAFESCAELRELFFYGDKPLFYSDCFYNSGAVIYYPVDNATWNESYRSSYGGYLNYVSTDYASSGVCGDNLKWEIANGVLTISGTGAMTEYSTQLPTPWQARSREITKVVIQNGVTSLSHKVCCQFENLTQVTIADSVQSIGSQAFLGCERLESIRIPQGVTTIGDFTFQNCYRLREVSLPDSVTLIDMDAFENCTSLKTIAIPGSVEWVGESSFKGCTSLESVTIGDGVQKIGFKAFGGCGSLKMILFAGDAPQIDSTAFTGVTAVACYPGDNATWTADVMQNYGGAITWVTSCDGAHTEAKDAAVKPGCTSTGLTEGSHCARCGLVIVAQETIPAVGHSFGPWKEIKAATTSEAGTAQRTCTACGTTEQKELPKLKAESGQPAESTPVSGSESTQLTKSQASEPTETKTAKPDGTGSGKTEQDAAGSSETEQEMTQTKATTPTASTDTAPTAQTSQPTEPAEQKNNERKTTPWGVIAVVGAVLLAGGAAAGYFLIRKRS